MAQLQQMTVNGTLTVSNGSGSILARNTPRNIITISTAGSYVWANILNNYQSSTSFFLSKQLYRFVFKSNNPAHYHAYRGYINTGDMNSGTASQKFVVRNIVATHSAWTGGCGGNPWTSIDTNGFTYYLNACSESIVLTVEGIG
jgi:hypothetical protein